MPGKARILSSKEISSVMKILSNPRDKSIFALGIYSGLRIGEIVQVKYKQVFTANSGIRSLLKVKRTKQKNIVYSDIPMHQNLKKILTIYHGDLEKQQWLFPSRDSSTGHLTRVQAHNILAQAFDSIGLEDASTHSMRRTCLTNMSRVGVPLRTIQEISGHASLSALQVYLAVDPDDKRRAINLLKY